MRMQADACADVESYALADWRTQHVDSDGFADRYSDHRNSYGLADRRTDACADIESYALADRHAHSCADVDVRACSACAISCTLWADGHACTGMHDDAHTRRHMSTLTRTRTHWHPIMGPHASI